VPAVVVRFYPCRNLSILSLPQPLDFILAAASRFYPCRSLSILSLPQPLDWSCIECAIHSQRDVREEQHHMYVARTSNNRVITACDLYFCLLPECEALRTCPSGFPITPFCILTLSYSFEKITCLADFVYEGRMLFFTMNCGL